MAGLRSLHILTAFTLVLFRLVSASQILETDDDGPNNGPILPPVEQTSVSPVTAFTTSAGGLSAICHDFECSIFEGTSEVMIFTVPAPSSTANARTTSVSRTYDPHTSSATVDYWTTASYTFANSTLVIPIPTGYTLPHPTFTSSNSPGASSWAPWTTASNSTGSSVASPVTSTGTRSSRDTTSVRANPTTKDPFTNATGTSPISPIHTSSTTHSTELNDTLTTGPSRTVTYTFTASYLNGSSSITTMFTETWTFPGGVSIVLPTASSSSITATARNSSIFIGSATPTNSPSSTRLGGTSTIFVYPPTMQGTPSTRSSSVNVTDTSTVSRTQSKSVVVTSFANTTTPTQPEWAGWTDWTTATTLLTQATQSSGPAQDDRTSRFAAVLTKRSVERRSEKNTKGRGRNRFF